MSDLGDLVAWSSASLLRAPGVAFVRLKIRPRMKKSTTSGGKSAAVALVALAVIGVAVLLTPKTFWLSKRPMFCFLKSHNFPFDAGWDLDLPLRDSAGNRIYFDNELNLAVFVSSTFGSSYGKPRPTTRFEDAKFFPESAKPITVKRTSDCLTILVPGGVFAFRLEPGEVSTWYASEEFRRPAHEDSHSVLDSLRKFYAGPDRSALDELIGRLENESSRGPASRAGANVEVGESRVSAVR